MSQGSIDVHRKTHHQIYRHQRRPSASKLHENKQILAERRSFLYFPRFSIRLFCYRCSPHLPATLGHSPSSNLHLNLLGRSWAMPFSLAAAWWRQPSPRQHLSYIRNTNTTQYNLLPDLPLAQITPPRTRKHLHIVQGSKTWRTVPDDT